MSVTHDIQTARVAEAFDGIAHTFERSLENDVTRKIRQRIYATIESLIPRGASILDINCGVGIDAVELARRGYTVTGVDVSSKMVEQARKRALDFGSEISFYQSSFENLSELSGKHFDLVLSNFGGLNCVSSLQNVAEQVAHVTRRGAYFIAVVMPPVCLWEIIAGLARFNLNSAFRRFQKNVSATGFRGSTFLVRYHSPRKFVAIFNAWFKVKHIGGFNITSPPPHAARFMTQHPRLSAWLERMDEKIAELPLLRSLGDHSMIILRKK